MPALRGELSALRKALTLRLKASLTPTIRPKTPASRAKLVVIFTKVRAEARAKGRQERYKGRKV